MTHWLEVFRYEVRQQFRRKSYLFITFGVPILALVIFFGYQAYRDLTADDEKAPAPITEVNEQRQSIGYVDQTPDGLFPSPASYPEVACEPSASEMEALNPEQALSQARSQLVKRISSPYCLHTVITPYPSLDEGQAALEAGDIDALYAIPPDYVETGAISAYVSVFSIEAQGTEGLMRDFLLRSLLINVDAPDYEALYLRLRNPAVISESRLTEAGAAEETREYQNFLLVYAFGLLLMLSVFWGGGYLMQSVVQEKETRIIEIMLSSVRPSALLLGKILAMGLLSLLQLGMLAGTFVIIASQAGNLVESLGDITVGAGTLVLLVVYFVLGFLLFGSLMAGIGALSTSVRDSQNLVTIVTLPAAIPFFFLTIFVEEPNGTLAVALSLFPITGALSMVMRIAIIDVPLIQLVLSLVLQVLGIAFAIWLAGRLFRVNTLLMGNMPKLRDLPRLVRG
ncbi:MAG: ABC transporter permease [Anaerolineae bacterium]|nr:ABC transporter permease [Anaerolineae bacterium]